VTSTNLHQVITDGPPNVILVSFDTLRRDHLHSYGHPKPLSPTMDTLAAQGVSFEDVVVNSGWTLPQHITLLTGVSPLRHGITRWTKGGGRAGGVEAFAPSERRQRLPRGFQMLAEIFRDSGYLTLGFANQNGFGGGWKFGFHRGMRHYTTIFPYNNMMERVVNSISECIHLAGSNPFFMYIHSNDTHEPFAASQPFGSQWGNSYQNRYEGEVTYVDHYLGSIVDELKRTGLYDRTLLVVTSDHGSEFREHGFVEKVLNLYEEISRIPLIMTLPAVLPSDLRVRGLCQTKDIAPTILDICDLPLPDQMDGVSLLPRILGREPAIPRLVYSHTMFTGIYRYEHFAARSDSFKFIRTVPLAARPTRLKGLKGKGILGERFARLAKVAQLEDGVWRELYDLKADPQESVNIMVNRPDVAGDMESALDDWIAACGYKPKSSRLKRRNQDRSGQGTAAR
jgi:arylsulfatase A-like enzyme